MVGWKPRSMLRRGRLSNWSGTPTRRFGAVLAVLAFSAVLAVLAVEEVTHGLSSRFVGLRNVLTLVGVHATFGGRVFSLRGTALRAAIGETGLVGPQFKLFFADTTNFDRKTHTG